MEYLTIKPLLLKGKTAFVLAHPDDETVTGLGVLAMLGTLSRYRAIDRLAENCLLLPTSLQLFEQGLVSKPTIYYATVGEKGNPNGVCTQEELPKVRRKEVQRAAKVLGAEIQLDHLGDGQLDKEYPKLFQRVFQFLQQQRPDHVVTFPPSGITRHSDHQAVSRATTEAVTLFNQIELNPIKLYYRVITPDEKGISGPYIEHDPLPVTHKIDVKPFQGKMSRAIKAHRTQVPEMSNIYPAFRGCKKNMLSPNEPYIGDIRRMWKIETFYRVL